MRYGQNRTVERKYMKFTPFAPPLTRTLALITYLLGTACFAHSLIPSLTQELMGKGFMSMN